MSTATALAVQRPSTQSRHILELDSKFKARLSTQVLELYGGSAFKELEAHVQPCRMQLKRLQKTSSVHHPITGEEADIFSRGDYHMKLQTHMTDFFLQKHKRWQYIVTKFNCISKKCMWLTDHFPSSSVSFGGQ